MTLVKKQAKEKAVKKLGEVTLFVSEKVQEGQEELQKVKREYGKVTKVMKIKEILNSLTTIDNYTIQYDALLNAAFELNEAKNKSEQILEELRNDIKNIQSEKVIEKYKEYLVEFGGTVGLRQVRKNLIRLEETKTKQTKKDFKEFNKRVKDIEKEILKISKKVKNKVKTTERNLNELSEFEKRIGEIGLIEAMCQIEETYEIIPNDSKKKRKELLDEMKTIKNKISKTVLKFVFDYSLQENTNKFSRLMNEEEKQLYKNVDLVRQTSTKTVLKTADELFVIVKDEANDAVEVLTKVKNQYGEETLAKVDENTETIKIERFVENFA